MEEKNNDKKLEKKVNIEETLENDIDDELEDEDYDEYDIDEYEKQRKKDKRDKIILIIIIIILLFLHLLCHKLGKIGYKKDISTNAEDLENMVKFDVIEIVDGDIKNIKNSQLNIFNNKDFDGEKIIAPKSNGEYKFCIENLVNGDLTYNIEFSDEMTNPINMKYRLKIDNIYIRGNEEEYVDIEELKIEDIVVLENSNNIYTLEWKWVDDDKADTYVGSQKEIQSYTLKLKINADNFQK